MKRFYVKFQHGHHRVIDRTKNAFVTGYSQKIDADKTAKGLNILKKEESIQDRIKLLKTTAGYGHYCK